MEGSTMHRALALVALIGVLLGSAACGQCGSTGGLEKRLGALEGRVAALEKKEPASDAVAVSTSNWATGSTSPSSGPRRTLSEAARRTLEKLRSQPMTLEFTDAHVVTVLKLVLETTGVDSAIS